MDKTAREEMLSRTEMLIGAEALEKLARARVAVFGVGGVGGYVTEALARSGIGHLDLIDPDAVAFSNLNRQIYALRSTVGRPKVEVARDRILDINPECEVRTYQVFFLPENKEQFDFSQYSYIVDAIDTVSGKLALAECAQEAGVPMISAMGAKDDGLKSCSQEVAPPPVSRSRSLMIWPVTVVPTLAPIMIPMDW